MSTNRTPVNRDARVPVTPLALKTFARMQQLARECVCDNSVGEKCGACQQWSELHRVLRREVQAKIWEFPCVVEPDGDVHAGNGRDTPVAF
jgi:hypothetical protein